MADITSEITTVISDHSLFNAKQLFIIISFVNGLDDSILHQFENSSDRSIMHVYERLLAANIGDRRGYDEENELDSLTGANRPNIAMRTQANHAFFNQYRSTPTRAGFGGNVYNDQTKSYYDLASKILNGLGGLATMGAGYATIAAVQAGSSLSSLPVRYALTGISGVSGLAGGTLAYLRNTFSDVQTANNKQFLETVKSVVKVRNKLQEFFNGAYNKITKDAAKAKTAMETETSSHPQLASRGAQRSATSANLSNVQDIVLHDFANANYEIKAILLPQTGDTWRVELSSLHGTNRMLTPLDMDLLQRIVNRL